MPKPAPPWVCIFAGATGLLVVSMLAILLVRSSSSTSAPSSAFSAAFSDSFDRSSSATELGSNGDRSWTADAGVWGVEAGAAILRNPSTGDNIATIDVAERNHTVNVRIAGLTQCGVVARYQDPLNFLMLTRVNSFAVWNLVEVVDGKEHLLIKIPDSGDHDVDVSLTATDHVVAASVGFKTVRIVHETAPQGTRVGLLSRGEGAAECSWDDFTAQRAN